MSWENAKVGEVASVVTKGTTPTTYGMPFTDAGVNFIKAEALNGDCTLDSSGFTFISESTHEKLMGPILVGSGLFLMYAWTSCRPAGRIADARLLHRGGAWFP